MKYRDIIHIDIDAFLASVEQIRDPALLGRAVVVGGEKGDRGLVLSSSYEARRHGVFPGLTLSQAARLLPNAVYLKGDLREAGRLAGRAWEIARRYTPLVEATSIDDCYLDVTGTERLFGPPVRVAERIRKEVSEEVGFRLSLGVGSNRTVARVATVFAKPGGVAAIPPGTEAAFLAPLPVRRLPGVGRRTEAALHRYNVRTIRELQRVPRWLLERSFGEVAGGLLFDRAHGLDDAPVRPGRGPRSVSRETSFDPETADRDVIEGMLFYLLERACASLREVGRLARTVGVKIRYVDGPGSARTRTLRSPAEREREFYGTAREILAALFTRRVRLKLLGVELSGFTAGRDRQLDLWQAELEPGGLEPGGLEPGGLGAGRPVTGGSITGSSTQAAGGISPEERGVRLARLGEGVDHIRDRFGFQAITAGRSIGLLGRFPQTKHGFVLKTPSLAK